MTDYAKRARQLFLNGLSCARAVAAAFGGIADVDIDAATDIPVPLCAAGSAPPDEICGAISGMCMAVDMIYLRGSDEAMAIGSKLAAMFRERFGSAECSRLLLNTTGDRVPAPDRKQICADYVEYAAYILAEQLRLDRVI